MCHRRISRSYLRQLWDDDYAALATEDAEKEIFFRSVRAPMSVNYAQLFVQNFVSFFILLTFACMRSLLKVELYEL